MEGRHSNIYESHIYIRQTKLPEKSSDVEMCGEEGDANEERKRRVVLQVTIDSLKGEWSIVPQILLPVAIVKEARLDCSAL